MFEWFAGGLLAMGVIGILLIILLSVSWLIAYVLISIGLYSAAKNRGIENSFLAWIPFARYYLLGKMLNNELVITVKIRMPYLQFILPALSIFSAFGGVFGSFFSLCFFVVVAIAYISLFRQYKEPHAIAYGLMASIPVVEAVGSVFVYMLGEKPAPPADADTTAFP